MVHTHIQIDCARTGFGNRNAGLCGVCKLEGEVWWVYRRRDGGISES
jgi:hypothetical protein